MRWQAKNIREKPVRSKGVPLSIAGRKAVYGDGKGAMVQKPLRPGGDTETEIETGRANDPGVTPLWVLPDYAAPILSCEARTELIGLVHNAPNSSVYRTFPTSRISRSNSFLTTS